MIRVLVNGALGRMGRETVRTVESADDLELVGQTDIGDDVAAAVEASGADVAVDFTVASAALANLEAILAAGAAAVIGTSGFGQTEVAAARGLAEAHGRPVVIAPNFALGAVLLSKYAADAAPHFRSVELLEMHHAGKEDAPSGTAFKVAADVGAARGGRPTPAGIENVPGVRGGDVAGVRVHSLRMDGVLARMEAILGGPGETLTIRHDSIGRESFMPGVLLAIRKVRGVEGLVYGLEHLL